MNMRAFCQLFCMVCGVLLLASEARADRQKDEYIELLEPGSSLPVPSDDVPSDWLTQQRWYGLLLLDGRLYLQPVRGLRTSDWLKRESSTASADGDEDSVREEAKVRNDGLALDLPGGSLFAMRIRRKGGARAIPLRPQGHQGLIAAPVTLSEGWKADFRLGGRQWTVRTEYVRRFDGALLAGSMSLVLQGGSDEAVVMLPPAGGMAFGRQELQWLGDIDQDGRPDAVLRRIWITGEQDYVMVMGQHYASLYIDTDRPQQGFSSGVEESSLISWHASQSEVLLPESLDGPAFNIGEQEWNNALMENSRGLPFTLADRQVRLGMETLRFSMEYLPRYPELMNEPSSSSADVMRVGPVLVRVTFRGRSQVLMQAPALDGGRFEVRTGRVDGQPVIQINHHPHYNNGFSQYWLYSESERRFRRVAISQEQGC